MLGSCTYAINIDTLMLVLTNLLHSIFTITIETRDIYKLIRKFYLRNAEV
ncbi:hypothetical protein WN55_04090 [Dufourea novaeangliae]|uniref:Uncharacterized protein n=1 Tax=Dufourea novaeangliae TaxID=178035 RepID=A0A154PM54_DUFNO|nr:hypothetical protein WN55_04090 [Dufourea novaeangliae]